MPPLARDCWAGCIRRLRPALFKDAPAGPAFGGALPEGARVLLYSNHPTGNMQPSANDLRNLDALPAGAELIVVCGGNCMPWKPEEGRSEP